MWLGRASMFFAGVSARLKSCPSERKRPGSRGVDRIFSETLGRGGTGSGTNQVHDKQKDRQSKQNVKGAANDVEGDKTQQPGDEHQNSKQQQHGSPRAGSPGLLNWIPAGAAVLRRTPRREPLASSAACAA